jgi:quinol monooxygenase YgiN
MIIVAGTIPIDPDKLDEALPVMKKMMDATIEEEGCMFYRFYPDVWDKGTVHVYEEWANAAALEAHMNTPHMAEFRAQLPQYVTGDGNIRRYTVVE